jgi:hypothetical protein
MAKTIIIGLGTTGLSIVNHIQKFHYEYTREDKPKNVEYIFCETAVKEEADKTPTKKESSIKKVAMPLSKSGDFIRNYGKELNQSWFPSDVVGDALGEDGAEGICRFGRLGLWKNWDTVKNAIENAHRGGSEDDKIYIIGSFMGGTCTGTFIDMAYLAQKITGSSNVFGFFLLPPANEESKITVRQSYLNAISTMRYYQKDSTNIGKVLYEMTWPDGKVKFNTKPFKHVFLFSREYQTYAKTDNDNVIQTIGMHICARLMDNAKLEDTIFTKVTDIINKADFNYSTIGTALISYPLSQLQQIVGLEKCQTALEKLNDEKMFFDKQQRKEEKIELKIKGIISKYQSKFEEILLDSVNCQDEEKLFPKVNGEISRIISENKISDINALFGIDSANNFYADVCDCKNSIKEFLVDKIYDMGVEIMKEYNNINILLEVINSIAGIVKKDNDKKQKEVMDFIGKCDKKDKGLLGFWTRKYGLEEGVNSYVKSSKKYLNEIIKNESQYYLLGQRKNYLIESSKNLLMLCKMHITIAILKEIKEAIIKGTLVMGANNALLTKPDIEDIKSILSYIVDTKKIENNIPKRITQVKANIQPDENNWHFSYLFYDDSEKDVAEIKRTTAKEPEIYRGDVLPYLLEIKKSTKQAKLFSDCLTAVNKMFEGDKQNAKTINEIVNRNRNNDAVFDKVKDYFDNGMDYKSVIRKKVPALLKLHGTDFENEANLQLIYSMANFVAEPKISGANSYLENIGDPATNTTTKNGVVLTDLENRAILIFQQYSQKDNNKWIDIVEDIDMNYKLYEKVNVEDLSKDNPYLTKDQIEKILEPLKQK